MNDYLPHRSIARIAFGPHARLALLSLLVTGPVAGQPATESEPKLRRPMAIATQGDFAFLANRESGSVSVLQISGRSLVSDLPVGHHLSDIVGCPDGTHLLALDEEKAVLFVLANRAGRLKVLRRIDVPPYPVSITISPNGEQCSIASLWPRQVTILKLASVLREHHPVQKTIDLEIAPRTQCWLSNDRLVVADSFGGKLTVINAKQARPVTQLAIDGHNIRGLSLNADQTQLFITHQILNSHEPTERQRVFWGDVMGNILRSVALTHIDELCRRSTDSDVSIASEVQKPVTEHKIAHWMFHPLGEPSNAAGDPADILVNSRGQTVVLLSGTNEVALRSGDHKVFARRAVGKRPIAGSLTDDGTTALVVNHFDDSVSFISLDEKLVTDTVSLGGQPELTLAQQGEVLFYDAHLSLDKWYSCHSCHTDGHTNGKLNDNFSDDSYGAPKRILSLLGVAHTAPWAWNGSQSILEEQVAKSIRITMQGQVPEEQRKHSAHAITAFLGTLVAPPPLNRLRGIENAQAIARGKTIFERAGCVECHPPKRYTSRDSFDMGVADVSDANTEIVGREFNPPSLRGLSQRGALLHDGSAKTALEVFSKSAHRDLTANLDADSVADLTTFLESL